MRVLFANYGHHAHHTSPEALLDEFHTLTGWAEGVAEAGAAPTVLQGFSRDHTLVRNGIEYRFVAGPFSPQLGRFRIPWKLHSQVADLDPEVVHLHGTGYALQAWDLRRRLPPGRVIVMQHHGGKPSRPPSRWLERRALRAVDGFFFTGHENATPWLGAGLIGRGDAVFEIMEGSSRFRLSDRERSRSKTGLQGRPVCVWIGNLDRNKDPLTVLAGFERALDELPNARLFLAFRTEELLSEVRERLATSPRLQASVELLGALPHGDIEVLLNSADVFVQGSHREASGYALVEALACGAVPVVTDIPSFRYMTAAGAVGSLFAPGDAVGLARALTDVASRPIAPQRIAARELFESRLGYPAIGRQALAAYRSLVGRKKPISESTASSSVTGAQP